MTAFVLCLSVAAGAMAWHFGFTRGVRIGKALEQEERARLRFKGWMDAIERDNAALAEFCAMLGDREVPE